MPVLQKNLPLLHTPTFQQMSSLPPAAATVANAFVANDPTGRSPFVLYVVSATVQYLYTDNGWVQIPSGALATFGAGACAVYHPWSNTYTANGGSTTTATVAAGTVLNAFRHQRFDTATAKTLIEFITEANLASTS
ncbi:MAG: hypothetical protein ACK59W_10365 [Pseudanabaena sp.]